MKTALLAIGLIAVVSAPAMAGDDPAPGGARVTLACNVGPVHHDYGGAPWEVYSCHGPSRLAFISTPPHTPGPYLIMLAVENGKVRAQGMGGPANPVAAAAMAQIQALTPAQVTALIAETEAGAGAPDNPPRK